MGFIPEELETEMAKPYPGWTYRTYPSLKEEEFPEMKVIPVLLRSFKQDARVQFPYADGWIELPMCKMPFKLLDWIDDQKGRYENTHTYKKYVTQHPDTTNYRAWGVVLPDSIMIMLNEEPVFIIPSHGTVKVEKVEFPYD